MSSLCTNHNVLPLIQGLIQIEMLKMIEQMTGKSIMELFDWIVGTSTGAILALGMVYGKYLYDPQNYVLISIQSHSSPYCKGFPP